MATKIEREITGSAAVGRMSKEDVEKRLRQTKEARERDARRVQKTRREAEARRETENGIKRSCEFLGKPFVGLSEMADRLRKERAEAERVALRRRRATGRALWVSRQAQKEAIKTANLLSRLGF